MTDYTGRVEPQGAASTRTLAHLTITKLSVGPMNNNAYLLVSRKTGEALLIDAADDSGSILKMVAAGPQAIQSIVTTHQHADHWQALAAVKDATQAASIAHPLDAKALPTPTDVLVEQDSTIMVGDVVLEFIHLRGHTPGSLAVLYRDPDGHPHLFTGDSLFPGGPGRTSSPEEFGSLMDDLEARVFDELPDDTWIYPGHGDDTTLGAERPHLTQWRARGW